MQGGGPDRDFLDEPIPFLEIRENKDGETEFALNPRCEQYLKQMTSKKIAVLTIAGPQRSGKSFLANRFLKKMSGFAIGPTTNPCTHGIWLWGKPVSLNSEVDLLIMDTEGLNSTQRDSTIDTKIFSISILLSSYFIYNSFGHIDETALENLSLVVHLTENISISSQSSSENDYAKFFPIFHWVLRDFSLDLKGRSSNQYLEYALQAVQSNDPAKQAKNNIRNKVKNFFKSRECSCLVRPVNEESRLAHIESQHWDELRPEFKESVEFLVNNVLASMRPKIIQGKPLTGEMLLNLTKSYLQALNTGGVPQILTSMERVVSSEMKRVFDTLVKEYMALLEEAFNEKTLPMPEEELNKKHKEITAFILKKLSTNGEIIGHKEVAMIQQKLHQGFEKNLKTKTDINEEKITILSSKAITKFSSSLKIPQAADFEQGFLELRPKIISPFKESYLQFYESFKAGLQGSSKKYSIFSEIMPRVIIDYYDKILGVCEQLKDEEVDDIKKKLIQAKKVEEDLNKILKENDSLLDQLKNDKKEIRSDYDNMRNELNKTLEKSDSERDSLKERIHELEVLLKTEGDKNTKLFDRLESGTGRSGARVEQEAAELRGQVEILQEKNRHYQREIDRLKETISDMERTMETMPSGNTTRNPDIEDSEVKKEGGIEGYDQIRPPQVESLISEIVSLQRKVFELEEEKKGRGGNSDEELNGVGIKDSMKSSQGLEEIELLDDTNIVEDQLLNMCPNEELKEKVKIIMTNYKRQKILFQRKLQTIFTENNKLKAEVFDLEDKLAEIPKMKEQIEALKKDNKTLNNTIDRNFGGGGKTGEVTLEMQLIQVKAENLTLVADRDNVFFFIKELLMKTKKKKGHHYEHAWSALNERDQLAVQDIYDQIGFKF